MTTRPLHLGRARAPSTTPATDGTAPYHLAAHQLATHGVCVGMTGSGKTGLCMVLVEEALRSRIPVVMIDVKGDLANLALTFPSLSPEEFLPWVDVDAARRADTAPDAVAAQLATRWREGLASWALGPDDVRALRDSVALRIITPGTNAAEPLHVLSALEKPSELWSVDEETARESLSAAIALLLRMIDREADPSKSRELVLLALFAEKRLRAGEACALETLVADLQRPPIARVGALAVDDFISVSDRASLAKDLNTLIASPTFSTWRQGAPLDPGAWLAPRDDGRTPAVIVSVAHLDDAERMLVISLVLEQMLAWVRGLSGTSDLRALLLFDEVYGFLPPHPAAPPSKRPLLALLKQARAFGVGVLVATQNPMDIDYKALSNAGVWFIGRLQTDADRARVVDGLSGTATTSQAVDASSLGDILKTLPGRTFYVRNVHDGTGPKLLESRWSLSWLRGPMTRQELRRVVKPVDAVDSAVPSPSAPAVTAPPAPVVATRSTDSTVANVPVSPEGWRTWHSAAPTSVGVDTWTYQPWVAATLVAHVRDNKLGVQTTRTIRAMAPLGPDGRPDTAKGRVYDPQRFGAQPAPGGRHAPLPDTLFRKNGPGLVVRTLRDEVYRSLKVSVQLHKGLGMVAGPDEPAAAFAARVTAEAQRRAVIAQQDIATRYAPKIQRAADDVTTERAKVATLDNVLPTGGALATAAALLRGGTRALQRVETTQDRQAAKLVTARAQLGDAESALREATAKRDAELAETMREAQTAAAAIETKTLAAKKDDIEATEIGVAWVPTPR